MQIADSLVFAATETESEFGGLFMQLNLPWFFPFAFLGPFLPVFLFPLASSRLWSACQLSLYSSKQIKPHFLIGAFAGRSWYLAFANFHSAGHILLCSNKTKLFGKGPSPKLTVEVNACPRLEMSWSFYQWAGRVFGTVATFLSANVFQEEDRVF